MSVQSVGVPHRERFSYMAPHIRLTKSEGAVSIVANPMNRFFSHTSLLVEGIGNDGRPYHTICSLNCEPDVEIDSSLASAVINLISGYGKTDLEIECFMNFSSFCNRTFKKPMKAFSLWKISQMDIEKLIANLEERYNNLPPASITGFGKVGDQRAYHCFSFVQEELEKIGIEAVNRSWFTLYGWIPVVKNAGDAHVGKIKGATCNCIGFPPHIKKIYDDQHAGSNWLSSIF